MHCLPTYLPACLSVCPTPHNRTRDQALKDVSTFTVSKLSYLFYCFFCFSCGGVWLRSMLCFYLWDMESSNLEDFSWIFYKKEKKKLSSTCNTDNRFYCIYVEKQVVLGGRFVNCNNRMEILFFIYTRQDVTLVDFWEDIFVLCHIWTYQRAPSRCLVIAMVVHSTK